MKSQHREIDNIVIDIPCSVPWSSMEGTNKVRYCDLCQLNVYNLSYLTETEIESLVASAGERLCIQLYRRRDGTIVTDRCPAPLRNLRDKGVWIWQIIASTLTILIGATASWAQAIQSGHKTDPEGAIKLIPINGPVSAEEWTIGINDLKSGKFTSAAFRFSQLTRRDQSQRAQLYLAICYLNMQDLAAAQAALQAASVSPDSGIRKKAQLLLGSIETTKVIRLGADLRITAPESPATPRYYAAGTGGYITLTGRETSTVELDLTIPPQQHGETPSIMIPKLQEMPPLHIRETLGKETAPP